MMVDGPMAVSVEGMWRRGGWDWGAGEAAVGGVNGWLGGWMGGWGTRG